MELKKEEVTTEEALPEETSEVSEKTDEVTGTTATLFGVDNNDDVPEETPKEETVEPELKPEAKTEEVPAEENPEEEPEEKLFTVIVDGEERQVTEAQLKKGYQTDQYLTKKGQEIAQLRKSLDSPSKEVSTPAPTDTVDEDDPFYTDTIKPYLSKIKSEIGVGDDSPNELAVELARVKTALGPTIYEQGLNAVDAHVKEELGQTDFMDYREKIEAHITSLPVEDWDKYDTLEGMTSLYSKFKITDPIVKAEPKATTKPKVPVKAPPSVEGGSGVSGVTSEEAAEKTKIFNKAKETGQWNEYFLKYPA